MLGHLTEQFGDEIRQVKELAIGTAVGLAADLIREAVPGTLSPRIKEILDGVTTKLGGRVVPSPILEPHRSEPDHNGASPPRETAMR